MLHGLKKIYEGIKIRGTP